MGPEDFYTVKEKTVLLRVKAKAHAREDGFLGVKAGELGVAVRAPAEKGKANAEIVRVIARTLGLAREDVVLKSGGSSPHKVFELPLVSAAALRKLATSS